MGIKTFVKSILMKPAVNDFCSAVNLHNKIRGRRTNSISHKGARLNNVKIYVHGKGNSIVISEGTELKNCVFNLFGNRESIVISKNCVCENVEFWLEDSESCIEIGKGTTFGKTHLAAIEGRSIKIGSDCMFSSGIVFQTGDAHSILDESGKRINQSQDIIIGEHVWVGRNAMLEKGTIVPDGCIIGAGAIVTKKIEDMNCVLAGIPAQVIRRNIRWERERI